MTRLLLVVALQLRGDERSLNHLTSRGGAWSVEFDRAHPQDGMNDFRCVHNAITNRNRAINITHTRRQGSSPKITRGPVHSGRTIENGRHQDGITLG